MTQVLSPLTGWLLLLGYLALMWLFVASNLGAQKETKLSFLVAHREVGALRASFSIAANWIWAPALFVAAMKAYTQGVPGIFWFVTPNALCLIVFAYFAARLRRQMPEGWTLSSYMRDRFGPRVQNVYLFQLCGLASCAFAVQLLAGGVLLSALTGIPFVYVTATMAGIALSYSLFGGLRASIATDFIQMSFILLAVFTLVPWAVWNAGGLAVVARGLGGISGDFTSIVGSHGLIVFLTFGLPATIGLMSGPFGDQSFYQRAFAIRTGSVKRAFIAAAFLFASVPLMLSLLGFTAAGLGVKVGNPNLVNITMILQLLPAWTVVPFVYMLLSGLVSTMDSMLCSVSSLAGHDLTVQKYAVGGALAQAMTVKRARIAMLLLCGTGVLIANIPGLQILHLFLFYGTLRASTLLPTVIAVLRPRRAVSEAGIFYGVLTSIIIGLPIFAYGNFGKHTPWIIAGSLTSVLASGTITLVATRLGWSLRWWAQMPRAAR